MTNLKEWTDEPTPRCDALVIRAANSLFWHAEARELERRLRHALKLVGKLRADSDCSDFDMDDLERRLTNIEETLTP